MSNNIKDHFSAGEKVIHLNAPIKYIDMEGKKILDTKDNLKVLLDACQIKVRYNMMTRSREIHIPKLDNFFDEKENADLCHIHDIAVRYKMPVAHLDDHLNAISWDNAFHPIRECILNKPWDGIKRADKFIGAIKTRDDEFSYKLVKRWMISAMAAAFSERGFSSQGVLVLQGAQNIGKTSWVKSLTPIGPEAIKEGLLLDPSNKDSIITASQTWIGELGELEGTFRKADNARLKGFITSSGDTIRFPYYRRNSYLARRTVFVATVNESKFLIDDTGNRRWWTIEVISIDLNHGLDMQQVWSEIYDIWKKQDERTWLSKDEMNELNQSNTEHELIDPFEELVLDMFDWDTAWKGISSIQMSATQVLFKLGYKSPTKAETYRMGKVLLNLTGSKPKKTSSLRLYSLPFLNPLFSSRSF